MQLHMTSTTNRKFPESSQSTFVRILSTHCHHVPDNDSLLQSGAEVHLATVHYKLVTVDNQPTNIKATGKMPDTPNQLKVED